MKKHSLLLFVILALNLHTHSQSGNYISFDGANRYMSIPHHADFNFSTTEEYTITCWINVNSYVTNARMVSKRGTSTPANTSGYEMWGTNSTSQFYAVNANSTSASVFSAWGTGSGNLNKWVHLAFVVSGAGTSRVINMYQDGALVKSSSNVSAYAVSNTLSVLIGKSNVATGYLNAKMDNLRFYKKGLTQAEVQADMTSTVTASTPNIMAAYDFENMTQTTVTDITGRNHDATLYNFPAPSYVTITGETVTKETSFTGRGNDNEPVIKAVLTTTGTTGVNIQEMVVNMGATTSIDDVESIKIYATGSSATFDPRNPTANGGVLAGTATPAAGDITITGSGQLISAAQNVLWITYKLKETATEGNKIDASFVSIKTSNQTYSVTNTSPAGAREILLRRKLLFGPGDYGSANYRIPAIITAADNSLVTITDKRKNGSGDLPGDIDLVCRRSTDGGATWTEPLTVALGTGAGQGFGDAVIIKTNTGKLVSLFVGGPGLWSSTPSVPIRSYVSTSTDNGVTWTTPTDITNSIFGSGCTNATRKNWYASFFGSGNGLCLTRGANAGRIMAVAAIRETSPSTTLNNYVVYSDDEGVTWNVSNKAINAGDEAKVTQLNNGDVLMSSRAATRIWAKSSDGGITWGAQSAWSQLTGNATNGDMVRYTSTLDGYDKNRILHTIPNASDNTRSMVTMFLSTDEGSAWPTKKVLCPGTSAYSSIAILPDGTIGVYIEEDKDASYKMYYMNFSLNWLTNGADTYTPLVVSTPEFSLTEGSYNFSQQVTITSSTAGASIYYTLDGTTPTTNSTLYTGAITLNETCTLKAIALKEWMTVSSVKSAVYTINNPATVLSNIEQEKFKLSPNPTNDDIHITFTEKGKYTISVLNLDGKILQSKNIFSQNNEIYTLSLSHLPAANYLVKIIPENKKSTTVKVMKQ